MAVDPYQAIENLKANIHKDDMQVIQKNKDLLLTVKLVTKDDVQKIRENPEVKKLEDQAKKEAKEYLKNEFKKNAKDTKDQLKKDGKKLLKNFMN
jgi:2',3'-cyclic-nucleotide 2'-phosphodiesterase (5'-nucleotidase family)